jgi:DNA-binding transcriptional ArsR family regulator
MKLSDNLAAEASAKGAEHMAGRLAALSHPVRIEIVRRLSVSGCCCCKDVVGSLDLAQSTVSQHLKVLVSAGLVRYAPHRQRSLYEVDRAALAELSQSLSGLVEACCAGAQGGLPDTMKKT